MQSGDGFVDNEMWLLAQAGTPCTINNQAYECWVEAGYIAGTGVGFQYFWADDRPNGGFFSHYVAPVQSADFGSAVTFTIVRRVDGNTFDVMIDINRTHQLIWQQSTNNTMVPDGINIGQELAGSHGAYAPTADYTNFILTRSDGTASFQSTDSTPLSNNPPNGVWDTTPSNSSTGGDFTTACC